MRGSTRTSRMAAYVASGVLVVSGTVLAATPAEAAPEPIGTNQGATWLADQLTNGLIHNPNYGGFNDYGLTVDTGFALQAADREPAAVEDIKDALADHVDDYITPFPPHSYTGGLAKLATFVGHPAATSFGGQNLVTQLEARVASGTPIEGRIEDAGYTPGDQYDDDSANVLGQAYAAHALANAGSSKKAAVTSFLLKQQCPAGGFRLLFNTDKADSSQSCTVDTDAEVDVTAIAVLQLASQSGDVTVGPNIDRAKAWLASKQKADGSWGGGASTEGSNANSTGLAAWALGDTADSAQAAQWLRARQATAYDACDRLSGQRGAIAYDTAGLAAGRSRGIANTEDSQDQWRRATAQALPAMEYLPADPSPANPVLTGPSGYLKAGSTRGLTTKGIGKGDKLCVTGPGAKVQGTATGSSKILPVKLPAGTATRTYRVRDAWGNTDTGSVKVLGKKTLPLYKTKSRVKRSGWVTVRIGRLASGEGAKIWYKGKVVRSGKATTGGVFSASFKVGSSLGRKDIVGHGQYGDIRRGATTIKVVR